MQTFVRYLWCLSMSPLDQVGSAWDSFVKLNVPEVDEDEMEDEGLQHSNPAICCVLHLM